jgi:hypothetical protein
MTDSPEKFKEPRFSEYRSVLEKLLEMGDLTAINTRGDGRDCGPWLVIGDPPDSDIAERLSRSFRSVVRKAAMAAGAPHRVALLDWWICKLTRGMKQSSISKIIQKSVDYCNELEDDAVELGSAVEPKSLPGLHRDKYPRLFPALNWPFTEPLDPLLDANAELTFREKCVWRSFDEAIDGQARAPRIRRRWIDQEGNKCAQTREDVCRRAKERVESRTGCLSSLLQDLSYDLAVVRANYVIDRDLRGDDAVRVFKEESAALVESVRSAWRKSSKRLGLSWRKDTNSDFEELFRKVGEDLLRLTAAMPSLRPKATQGDRRSTSESPTCELSHGRLDPPAANGQAQPPTFSAQEKSNTFRKNGATWMLSFDGRTVHVAHLVGLGYIAELLRHPRTEIEATSLVIQTPGKTNRPGACGNDETTTATGAMRGIEMSDPKTIKACKNELARKREELAHAPSSQKGALQNEISKIEHYLKEVSGLHGQPRKEKGIDGRARGSVSGAIGRAIREIGKVHPSLSTHLMQSIKKGSFMIYLPIRDLGWHL